MLVLSRKPDEWVGIEISREEALAILSECGKIRIEILLIDIQAHRARARARLGFTADERITIHRQEIWDDINLNLPPKPALQGVAS